MALSRRHYQHAEDDNQPHVNKREPLMHGPGSERRAALTLRQMEARTAEVRRAAAPSKDSRGECSHGKN